MKDELEMDKVEIFLSKIPDGFLLLVKYIQTPVVIDTLHDSHPSIQFISVTQSCPTLYDPVDFSMPGFAVHQQLLKVAQTHVHRVSDAVQLSHPLLSPSPAFNLSQLQGLFQWVSSLHQVVKVLEFQLQHQSFQWIFRIDFQTSQSPSIIAV